MPSADEATATVPAGPLAVEWQGCELPPLRAGVLEWAAVSLRNAGTVTWQPPDETERGIWLSFHWLDRLGNAMVWEGHRTALPRPIEPAQELTMSTAIRGPIPPGPYRLAFDLVDEGRCWFADVGNRPLEVEVDVVPRLLERTLEIVVAPGPDELRERTQRALARQSETITTRGHIVAHLAPGCAPRPDWASRLLDAHDEGYAVVGGSVSLESAPLLHRRAKRALAPWSPGSGRKPNWSRPLICPSIASEIRDGTALGTAVAGLPAIDPASSGEPWLYDGRIVIDVPARVAQPADRRPA